MNSFLQSLFLLSFFMVISTGSAQETTTYGSLHEKEILLPTDYELDIEKKKVFSYGLEEESHDAHDHGSHEIVLLDVISSDNDFDFNCSGGFCMNNAHFHKKGLTTKKQLFEYFMNIKC